MARLISVPSLLIGTAVALIGPVSTARAGSSPAGAGTVPATYPTQAEAEAAAPKFGCKGAHRMGTRWMPCAEHPAGGATSHPAGGH